eukprot:TRINITY_DN20155_c0_g1_i1.p1 TRINITY_DN20155_c0_g1~~TRINITY_DN20155_c0_g1_i1.p1  ORF type:complete len:115 (-),score=27.06 TRINITY_DN20155_c0_g1_i1:176-520(-)
MNSRVLLTAARPFAARSFRSSAPMMKEAAEDATAKGYLKRRTPLELLKFGMFVSIPVIMMLHFRHPENLNYYIQMCGYVKYPAEADRKQLDPDVIMREIDALRAKKADEKPAGK